MRHIVGKLSTSSFQRYKVCANRSSDEGVMAPGSRGVGAVFVHSSDADSGQTGNAIGEPRVPRRSRSHYLSNAPGLADQLVASRKDSAREGGSCAAYFCKVPDLRKSELGLVRYGPANRGHRGVFGPFEGSFPIGIPAGPDKILGDPRVPRRAWMCLLSNVPGLADQLVASQEDSVRKRDNVGGEIPELSAKPYFVGLFSRAWPCTEASLGSQDMILRTEAVGMFLMPRVLATTLLFLVRFRPVKYEIEALDILYTLVKGWSVRSSFWSGQWSGQTLVKLGQPWSNLVKLGQSSPNSWRCIPGPHFKGSRVRWVLVGLETARSNLGQTLRSTLVKLGQTLGNVSRTFFLGVFEVMSPRRNRPTWFGLPRFACRHPRKSRGTLIDDQSSPTRPIAANRVVSTVWNLSPNRLRSDLTWGLPKLQIGLVQRFGISVQTAANRVVSTVWNLSPNRLRSDLTWGLPKLQIGLVSTVWNLSPNKLRSDLTWGLPKLQIGPNRLRGDLTWGTTQAANRVVSTVWNLSPNRLRSDLTWGLPKLQIEMSDRGSGSGGHRRSDRLAKGKAVAYAPESSPDTDDEYDAMEDVRTRLDASLARNLQAELDAEAAGLAPSAARPPPRPGVVIGRSARPSETTRPSPQPGVTTGPSDAPSAAPRRPHTRSTGFRYPPHGGIRPRYPVAVEISDTPLLTNLLAHPSSLVRRCQEPPDSAGRGGWSDFCRLLEASRPEYREFLIELGFGPFLSIPYVSVYHPAVWCFIERFFHHTGTFHLSTCEMAVLPVDWSAILGIRFGGRAPPSEPIDGFEAMEILGLADRDAIEGSRRPSVRIRHLADVLRRDREEPPTELRYRQWAAYFIFSCFLGNDRSIVPTPIVGMFRDIDTLREYDWGALTYGFYIRGLRRYSRRESISFLGFWQFTVFWAFEHFPTFAPSRLPLASDPDFPLARRMLISSSSPYSAALSQRPEVFRAVALSRLRLWIRTSRSWELLLGERTVRQLGDEAVVPVDPSPLMTIEDYIPRAPSDPYIAGVSAYPSLVREDVPYQEWFERVSLGSLMSLHEVEGGRVMGGVAMDSHLIRSSGQIERLESEILRLQLELSVSVDRHTADMDRVQGEMASMQTEATQREGEMVQMRRDLASRDAEVARLAAAVRRLEEQLQGMGITPVTGAGPSGFGQPSSSPPRDPVSRDWFFDDPPSS
uniref:Aminotransferase-like plant mobile domain-containing protein n=1 Tax=Fagus sylvatica TaxID=28930 RepID=A0A2N9ID37_FAGSY